MITDSYGLWLVGLFSTNHMIYQVVEKSLLPSPLNKHDTNRSIDERVKINNGFLNLLYTMIYEYIFIIDFVGEQPFGVNNHFLNREYSLSVSV